MPLTNHFSFLSSLLSLLVNFPIRSLKKFCGNSGFKLGAPILLPLEILPSLFFLVSCIHTHPLILHHDSHVSSAFSGRAALSLHIHTYIPHPPLSRTSIPIHALPPSRIYAPLHITHTAFTCTYYHVVSVVVVALLVLKMNCFRLDWIFSVVAFDSLP
jgi:hypothetical protein